MQQHKNGAPRCGLVNHRAVAVSIGVLVLATLAVPAAGKDWKEQGVTAPANSRFATLTPVPIHAVTMADGFWLKRMKANANVGIPALLEIYEGDGVIDNFRRLAGKKVERKNFLWSDEYLYKLMEAMAYVLQSDNRPELRKKLDELVDTVVAAQDPSGYLNTYWVEERAPKRLTWMQGSHELYCFGHLLQAAVAYYRTTGDRRLLDAGSRYLDFLVKNYGRDKKPLTDGHPEAEMALVEFYRATGDKRALDFAGYLLEGDGKRMGWTSQDYVNLFAGVPFTSRKRLEGHAVRCIYAVSGATDYYAETGGPAYGETLERLWQDLVRGKMYITGGVGSRMENEAFGEPYELPNRTAWAESCAAIANLMWQHRMLQIKGEARFADVMEQVMYNGMNSGFGIEGNLFCYRNPLERGAQQSRGASAMCCSPNLNRAIAAAPGYFYSTSADGVFIHLFDNSTLKWHLADGTALELTQKTGYPWNGNIAIDIKPEKASNFTVHVRVPGWSRTPAVSVNGAPVSGVQPGQYLAIRRDWKGGDRITMNLDVEPRLVTAHPLVEDDTDRVTLARGPLVYCLEQMDQPASAALGDLSLALNRQHPEAGFSVENRPDLLGGIDVLKHQGAAWSPSRLSEPLYKSIDVAPSPAKTVDLVFIPFYANSNREPTAMQVWTRYQLN